METLITTEIIETTTENDVFCNQRVLEATMEEGGYSETFLESEVMESVGAMDTIVTTEYIQTTRDSNGVVEVKTLDQIEGTAAGIEEEESHFEIITEEVIETVTVEQDYVNGGLNIRRSPSIDIHLLEEQERVTSELDAILYDNESMARTVNGKSLSRDNLPGMEEYLLSSPLFAALNVESQASNSSQSPMSSTSLLLDESVQDVSLLGDRHWQYDDETAPIINQEIVSTTPPVDDAFDGLVIDENDYFFNTPGGTVASGVLDMSYDEQYHRDYEGPGKRLMDEVMNIKPAPSVNREDDQT